MTTAQELAGQLYVYLDENGDAAAISRWRVGPNGGLSADGIARMHVPQKHITRDEINRYALNFAAAPDLLAAARKALNYIENTESELGIKLDSGDDLRAAIAKAQGR